MVVMVICIDSHMSRVVEVVIIEWLEYNIIDIVRAVEVVIVHV